MLLILVDKLVVFLWKKMETKAMFEVQNWHRRYGEALLETRPSKLGALIATAEREIRARHLELSARQTRLDEDDDLQNAADALLQLKRVKLSDQVAT